MEFTPAHIKSFKDLYKEKFETDLNDQEVLEQLNKLISIVKASYKPITVDQYIDYKLNQIKQYDRAKI